MGRAGHHRSVTAGLVVLCALATVAVGPAGGLSPPSCNEATGIARLDDGWVLSSWDRIETFDEGWEEEGDDWSGGENRTFGVARGPNGSLWALQNERVVRLSESWQAKEVVELGEPVWVQGTSPGSADLAFAGRWLVLDDGEVTSYNASWGDRTPDPQVQTVVPNDTHGLYATAEWAVFVTGNGTLVGTQRRANGTFTRGASASLNVSGEAVDIHPGPDRTWLVVQPGNVTAYDRDLVRLGQRADVFSPEGCDWSGDGYGWGLAFPILVLVGLYGLGFLLVIVVVVGLVRYLR